MATPQDVLSALVALEKRLVGEIDSRFDARLGAFGLEMNARFDSIEKRLDRLIETSLRAKVAELEARIRDVETRLAT